MRKKQKLESDQNFIERCKELKNCKIKVNKLDQQKILVAS